LGYTKKEILRMANDSFSDIENFYKLKFLNYKGVTVDTREYYNEIVAGIVHDSWEEFSRIRSITRRASYWTESHSNQSSREMTNRIEERIAVEIFRQRTFQTGKILDYQTPLKDKRGDNAGKIDLLMYDGSLLYLLELKRPDSQESMLRCILEGHTYFRIADHKKLLKDFKLPPETIIKPAPLIFEDSYQHGQLFDNRSNLLRLIGKIEQDIFIVKEYEGIYDIYKYEKEE